MKENPRVAAARAREDELEKRLTERERAILTHCGKPLRLRGVSSELDAHGAPEQHPAPWKCFECGARFAFVDGSRLVPFDPSPLSVALLGRSSFWRALQGIQGTIMPGATYEWRFDIGRGEQPLVVQEVHGLGARDLRLVELTIGASVVLGAMDLTMEPLPVRELVGPFLAMPGQAVRIVVHNPNIFNVTALPILMERPDEPLPPWKEPKR